MRDHLFVIVRRVSERNRILVIEDDSIIAARVYEGLRDAGFSVELANDVENGTRLATSGKFDLIVLDLMLDERMGYEVLEALSERMVPTIVLTARVDLDSRLKSFELGAVDFVTKPFWIEEILARIRARLHVSEEREDVVVTWGQASLRVASRELSVAGVPVALTPHELDLLIYLATRPGRAVSRRQLVESALREADCTTRTVDSHVTRLRRKLGPEDSAALRTVRSIGYCFRP